MKVIGTIKPLGNNPVVENKDIAGGIKIVKTIQEMYKLNAPTIEDGSLVYVIENKLFYISTISNGNASFTLWQSTGEQSDSTADYQKLLEQINAVSEDVDSANNTAKDAFKYAEDAATSVASLKTTVDSHTSTLSTYNSTHISMSAQIATNKSDIAKLNTSVTDTNTDVGKLNNTISGVQATINGYSEKIDKIDTIEDNLGSLSTKITSNENKLSTQQTQIASINTSISSIKEDIDNIATNDTIEKINSNITALQNKVNGYDSSISNINTSIGTINSNITNVQETVGKYEEEVESIGNSVDNLIESSLYNKPKYKNSVRYTTDLKQQIGSCMISSNEGDIPIAYLARVTFDAGVDQTVDSSWFVKTATNVNMPREIHCMIRNVDSGDVRTITFESLRNDEYNIYVMGDVDDNVVSITEGTFAEISIMFFANASGNWDAYIMVDYDESYTL
jgi:predicted  nucleic acid-binding Zn-ribbon protein